MPGCFFHMPAGGWGLEKGKAVSPCSISCATLVLRAALPCPALPCPALPSPLQSCMALRRVGAWHSGELPSADALPKHCHPLM